MLGFCLPLSGGLPLSQWHAGYPDRLTPIHLVTFISPLWLLTAGQEQALPIQAAG